MSILSDSLLTKDIRLGLKTSDRGDALEELLSPLRTDPRILDWEMLAGSIRTASNSKNLTGSGGMILLHHGRTESVSSLVLAAGRSATGFEIPGSEDRIHLVFLAAIPETLNNEYLRVLGAISRVCLAPGSLRALLEAPDPANFLSLLEKGCLE
jgi:PTS system fructose-specific IIC component